jgi:hypothetical protein
MRRIVFFKFEFLKGHPNSFTAPIAEIQARHDGTYARLTPSFTEAELDRYIDQLVKELEDVRQEGRRKFAAAKNKLRQQT